MKKLTLCIAAIGLMAFTHQAAAQTAKQVKKEVSVEDENGVKVLTITTTTDGQTQTEVYKGADADAKMKEFADEKSGTTKTMVIGEDGQQHLKVEKKVVVKEEEEENQ